MAEITPFLWFENQAEEAVQFYVSVFADARIDSISRYPAGGPLPEGTAMVVEFTVAGNALMALNGSVPSGPCEGQPPVSLFVTCDTQAELDGVWDKLASGGSVHQCGWLTDKYGITWNIVPDGMSDYLGGEDDDGRNRAMQAMMQMVKLDIDAIRRAYEGVAR